MKVANIPNIIPTSTVLSANRTSITIPLYQDFGYSIQIVFTGTPTGTFKLQASDDPVPQNGMPFSGIYTATNWTDVANSSQAVSAAGSIVWNVSDVMYNYVRVVYTDGSSGSSTAIITSAICNLKGI